MRLLIIFSISLICNLAFGDNEKKSSLKEIDQLLKEARLIKTTDKNGNTTYKIKEVNGNKKNILSNLKLSGTHKTISLDDQFCTKYYKKRFSNIKAYKLLKTLSTTSMCGYSVIYTQDGKEFKEQIMISRKPKKPIINVNLEKVGLVDICEHSLPIDNELNCTTEKDYFSVIAHYKNEQVEEL